MKVTISLLAIIIISNFTIAQQNYWDEPFGPYGGTINAFCSDSNNTLYVATYRSCLYKTTNNGENWTHLSLPNEWPYDALSVAAKSNGLVIFGADNYIYIDLPMEETYGKYVISQYFLLRVPL